jgi:hypothetical protein
MSRDSLAYRFGDTSNAEGNRRQAVRGSFYRNHAEPLGVTMDLHDGEHVHGGSAVCEIKLFLADSAKKLYVAFQAQSPNGGTDLHENISLRAKSGIVRRLSDHDEQGVRNSLDDGGKAEFNELQQAFPRSQTPYTEHQRTP